MNILKNIFSKEEVISNHHDFWNWFKKNEKTFHKVVKSHKNIEKDFFNKLSPKLDQIKEGLFYLAGMCDQSTAELIITPDGTIKNIVFAEELVESAPSIEGWKFTALKPPFDIKTGSIEMNGYSFGQETISFYATHYPQYPDEIEITLVHNDFNEENKSEIANGCYIFLDNYLGELNSITTIDSLNVIGKSEVKQELVPIEKLRDYLIWREKEFVEKYQGERHTTDNDNYSSYEAELENGNYLLAIINTDLLQWDKKASHPWITNVEIKYDGAKNNGMPDDKTYALLNVIEEEIIQDLKDYDGYLNVGRQTADGIRQTYFCCRDFRKPSKVLYTIQQKYHGVIEIGFDVYKDKYWRTFERFGH